MRMNNFVSGLLLPCLMMLSGCSHAPTSSIVGIIESGCPIVTPCYLPANDLSDNQSLINDYQALLSAWHHCATQVEMIYQCQQQQNQINQTTH